MSPTIDESYIDSWVETHLDRLDKARRKYRLRDETIKLSMWFVASHKGALSALSQDARSRLMVALNQKLIETCEDFWPGAIDARKPVSSYPWYGWLGFLIWLGGFLLLIRGMLPPK